MSSAPEAVAPRPAERLIALVGGYGSGKTEVAVNLALHLRAHGLVVQIADLDLVNPYFRCREAREAMEAAGVRVVVPEGPLVYADLPIVTPQVAGLLAPAPGTVSILDVGGDDVGSRVLSSFRPLLREGAYELWQVVNARRPFSATVGGCLAQADAIAAASRLRITGLVSNAHLLDATDADVVLEGVALTRAVALAAGIPLRLVAALGRLADDPRVAALPEPLLRLERRMLPPWLRPETRARCAAPAPRTVPVGVATHARLVPEVHRRHG